MFPHLDKYFTRSASPAEVILLPLKSTLWSPGCGSESDTILHPSSANPTSAIVSLPVESWVMKRSFRR